MMFDKVFPQDFWDSSTSRFQRHGGIDILEYFAGCALKGIMSNDKLFSEADSNIAIMAYDMAEVMVTEGKRRKEKHAVTEGNS